MFSHTVMEYAAKCLAPHKIYFPWLVLMHTRTSHRS